MFRTPRRLAASAAGLWALTLACDLPARAQGPDEPTRDPAVTPTRLAFKDRPVAPDSRRGPRGPTGAAGSTWWVGPVGVSLACLAVGGASLAARRFGWNLGLGAAGDLGPIGVVGQARLTPKQSVYLVRVGGRVLILGAGVGGSPTPLGEVTDPAELARLVPARPGARPVVGPRLGPPGVGFDRRIGDDE